MPILILRHYFPIMRIINFKMIFFGLIKSNGVVLHRNETGCSDISLINFFLYLNGSDKDIWKV